MEAASFALLEEGDASPREIQTSVRLMLPGELAKHAVSSQGRDQVHVVGLGGQGARSGSRQAHARTDEFS